MIMFPWPPRKAWLLSFWLVISLVSALFIGALSVWFLSPQSALMGVLAVFGFATPGLLWPQQVVEKPYQLWNTLVSSYTRSARFVMLGLCFYVTFVAVGRLGSALRLARPNGHESMWVPRDALTPATYVYRYDPLEERDRWVWSRRYYEWATQSGNRWSVCLLPFLLFIRFIEPEEPQKQARSHIYTLF